MLNEFGLGASDPKCVSLAGSSSRGREPFTVTSEKSGNQGDSVVSV